MPFELSPQRHDLCRRHGGGVCRSIATLATFLAVATACFLGFRFLGNRCATGDSRRATPSPVLLVQVTGPSMAPTLWGPHSEIGCHACGVRWKVHWQSQYRPQKAVICWNCGESVSVDQAAEVSGDTVAVVPMNNDRIRRGELVAIVDGGPDDDDAITGKANATAVKPSAWLVKRVAAVPGQAVSHQGGWLFVDEQPLWAIDDVGRPIRIEVHDDRFRNASGSWWQPRSDNRGLEQLERAFEFDAATGPTGWLDYHHRAVHDAMRPDVIRDDVPSNVAEVRALVPVDSFLLSFEAESSESAALEVRFHVGNRTSVIEHQLPAGTSHHWLGPEAAADTSGDLLVSGDEAPSRPRTTTQQHVPLAIRLISGQTTLKNLVVWRPLRYRIDPRAAAKQVWPIRLEQDQYYLLGDNVPLSIDSRHWGPIPRGRIVGRIYTVGYDNP